jgi:NADH dehydrogenase
MGMVGRNFFIEGQFARLMYRMLYKMHEAALHGTWRTMMGAVSGDRPSPSVKLH